MVEKVVKFVADHKKELLQLGIVITVAVNARLGIKLNELNISSDVAKYAEKTIDEIK